MSDLREQEMRRRREEQRRNNSRRSSRMRQHKNGKKTLTCVMLVFLLIGALIALSLTVLFPIKTIKIEGNSRYSAAAVQTAASITKGSNLLRLNTGKVATNIRRACPYIESVTIKRKLPFTVFITVKESDPVFAVCLGSEYLLLNRNLELIEKSDDPHGGLVVYGAFAAENGVGTQVTFADEDKKNGLLDIYAVLESLDRDNVMSKAEKIDLFDISAIRLQYGNHIWKIGDCSNLEYKVRFALQVDPRESDSGTLDLSGLNGGKNGYFKSEVIDDFVESVTPTDAK